MKTMKILLLVVFALLAACQSGTSGTAPEVEEVEQPVEQQGDEGYPSPSPMDSQDPYPLMPTPPVSNDPYPAVQAPVESTDPYPALHVPIVANDPYAAPVEEGVSITWEETRTLILNGEVAQVTQLHSLEVTLILKDGRIFYAVEPEIDAVFILLDECGEKCTDVIQATE